MVATEFYIPKMSDHMEQGVFVEWLVDEGDSVDKGQPILVIDTDKVVAEVEAPASGFLTGIRRGLVAGASISVGTTVAFIVEDLSEDVPVLQALDAASPGVGSADSAEEKQDPAVSEPVAVAVADVERVNSGPVRSTPAGRKAARALGVDLSSVDGTGPGGRVSESDVRAFASIVKSPQAESAEEAGDRWLKLTPVQSITARRMVESVTTVPQFSVTRDLDMSDVVEARAALAAEGSPKPSVTAFLVKTVASALSAHPRVNGFFRDGGIEINTDINVGVAMGTPEGLYVPVIHNADRLSIDEISEHLRRLQRLVEDGGFSSADLEGGTFTLSNLGMYGVDQFRAIVNPPQAAILATGRVAPSASVDADGAIRVRNLMTATMTADHRSLDGVAAAQFLASISSNMERINPSSSVA